MKENIVRTILKNEITWLIIIVGGVMGFVSTVILPIEKIQIQLAQISQDINETKSNYQTATNEISSLKSRLDILETEVKSLIK